jgi:hypothetical protein
MIFDCFYDFMKKFYVTGWGLCFRRCQYRLCQLFDIRPSQSNPASPVEIEGMLEYV